MAIRTISIIQGHYTALHGYWTWDTSSHFNFTSLPHQHHSQVPFNTPSTTPTIDCPSVVVVETKAPDDANCLGDDPESSSLDSSLCSIEFDPPSRFDFTPQQETELCGLGISGLLNKDGKEPFTGLGIVSVRSSFSWQPPRNSSSLALDLDASPGSWVISDTILQETLKTFCDDSLHAQALESIPECKSWYGNDDDDNTELSASLIQSQSLLETTVNPAPPPSPVTNATSSPISTRLRPVTRIKLGPGRQTFNLPTISSELKRRIFNTDQSISSDNRCNNNSSNSISRSSTSCTFSFPSLSPSGSSVLGVQKRRSMSTPVTSHRAYIDGFTKSSERGTYMRLRTRSVDGSTLETKRYPRWR